ncbi:S-adenosyl-L-methionine-dependent methyltransferase [Echria macrotheca]|uniref:S-adenosyl-L-methionine-dependent methyltransferase n=1 Tax=Echria macrotheca TaxID=438768 RepID=A0AAJ0F2G9_9PEZI|nr:S-adenosyl-L-methionine-dependent methyltransferase [Echria macrotheca]
MAHVSTTDTSPEAESFAEKNAKHFNKVITGELPQWVRDLHGQITDFFRSPEFLQWLALPDHGDGGRRLLDYACGDGVVSRALQPHFASVLGVDVSGAMLDKYSAAVAKLGLSPDQMRAVRGDLLADDVQPTDPPLAADALLGFDLVVTSMALHHFEDPGTAIKRLAARLRPGGVLLVIDWTPLDGSTPAQREYEQELRAEGKSIKALEDSAREHAAKHTISKPNGFTQAEMVELFERAGCGEVGWKLADKLSPIPVVNAKAQLFWSRASRPEASRLDT